MPAPRILIAGAGVAGSILAHHLSRAGFSVVVAERSRASQKLGQGIEIEEPALSVVRAMGVLPALEARKTGELGFELVDEHSRSRAAFDVADGVSPTGALELMRGDLTEVLYRAADESANVEYRFETSIRGLSQTEERVTVELERRGGATQIEDFDLVVGADGARSRTRQLLMGAPEQLGCYKPVGAYVAYFSIPRRAHDWPNSRLCHFPGRRVVWIRPVAEDAEVTSVYLIHVADDVPALRAANAAGDRRRQKEAFAKLYAGLGWEVGRVVEGMMAAENFYSDELAQVRLPTWSEGRVALVGDAAWAPTPFTGEGNQLAIIGAWVLAQELVRGKGSAAAFARYEKRLRGYVEQCQEIPLWGYGPYVFVPESRWGMWALRTGMGRAAWTVRALAGSWVAGLFAGAEKHPAFDLEMEVEREKRG